MNVNSESTASADRVIELGVIRLPVSVGPNPAESFRPRICLFVDQNSGMVVHHELTPPLDDYVPLILKSLPLVTKQLRGTPLQIQVRDVGLAVALKATLETNGIDVVVRESLPMLDEAAASLLQRYAGEENEAARGVLDEAGMTLEHLAGFADAAKAFYQARPWRHLIDDDLIEIQSPDGPAGTRFAQILGAAGKLFGLGFVCSRPEHEAAQSEGHLPPSDKWALFFDVIDHIPVQDAEAWEIHQLPVAGPKAYPIFVLFKADGGIQYPAPDQLSWAEGLLRALAATREDELDSGQWQKAVRTVAGDSTYRLSLPILLEQLSGKPVDAAMKFRRGLIGMEPTLRAMKQKLLAQQLFGKEPSDSSAAEFEGGAPDFVPTNDAERAQTLCYQAFGSRGRRQIQLARQALSIDPDCCDALCLLAERESDVKAAREILLRAVEAGERQIGPEAFKNDAGSFWGIIETRPYMRARRALAHALVADNELPPAIAHFDEMLRLNPVDNQANRYDLAQCLLKANQLDRLDELLNRSEYHDDFAAEWAFTKTLLEYRRAGKSPDAKLKCLAARDRNPFVIPFLTGRIPLPPVTPPYFQPGSEEEAIICTERIAEGWHAIPGALDWLKAVADPAEKRARHWQRGRTKKRKGR